VEGALRMVSSSRQSPGYPRLLKKKKKDTHTDKERERMVEKLHCFPHLWDSEASNGKTRDDIRPEKTNIVLRAPLEYRKEKLKSKNQLVEACLILESVEWVIWEEDL